jgi:hypothetical protein
VQLKFQGISTLIAAYKGKEFKLDEGVAVISLTGNEAKDASLTISYKEYAQGDAAFSLTDTGIKGKTKSGKPFLITKVEGKLPRTLNLDIKDGAGNIYLAAMQDNAIVALETGAGNISLNGSNIKNLSTKTGAGNITLTNCKVDNMQANSGVGNITLKNSKVAKRDFNTGVGKVIEE